MILDPHPIILFSVYPALEIYHQLNIFCHFHGAYTVKPLHVQEPDSPNFQHVTNNLRRRANQRFIGNAANFNNIVRYKTVSPFDKLQSSLAFSDAAVAVIKTPSP